MRADYISNLVRVVKQRPLPRRSAQQGVPGGDAAAGLIDRLESWGWQVGAATGDDPGTVVGSAGWRQAVVVAGELVLQVGGKVLGEVGAIQPLLEVPPLV